LTVVLAMLGLVAGIALPRFADYRDQIEVEAATNATVALLSTARHAAVRRSTVTAIAFDSTSAVITVFAVRDTIECRPLFAVHGVRLAVTRDSIAYAANGMGYGAANTRVILSRGRHADTITVSRLGRVRR
jgi:Tfp pilus assembly protein FimT